MYKKIIILTSEDNIINFPLIKKIEDSLDIKILSVICLNEKNSIVKKIKLILLLNIINILEIIFKLLTSIFLRKNSLKNLIFFKDVNSKKTINFINSLKGDLLVCINNPQIFTSKTINSINVPMYNFHPGDIPSFRGVFIPFYLLKNKINRACLTFHKIEEQIDNGKIMNKKYYVIKKKDNIYSIYKKIFISAEAILFITDCIKYPKRLTFDSQPKNVNRYYTYPKLKDIILFRFGL